MDQLDNYLIYLDESEELEEFGIITTALFAAPMVFKGAQFAFKNTFNKAHKACRGMQPVDSGICMRKHKVTAYQAQLSKLKAGISKCGKDKNPVKCRQKIQSKISNVQIKLQTTQNALKRTVARQRGK